MQRSWKSILPFVGRTRSMAASTCSISTSPSGSERTMFSSLSQNAVAVPSVTTSTGMLVSKPTFRSVAWMTRAPRRAVSSTLESTLRELRDETTSWAIETSLSSASREQMIFIIASYSYKILECRWYR